MTRGDDKLTASRDSECSDQAMECEFAAKLSFCSGSLSTLRQCPARIVFVAARLRRPRCRAQLLRRSDSELRRCRCDHGFALLCQIPLRTSEETWTLSRQWERHRAHARRQFDSVRVAAQWTFRDC